VTGPRGSEPTDEPVHEPEERDVAPSVPRWRRTQTLGWWWLLPVGLAAATWVLLQGELRQFGYAVGAVLGIAGLLRLLLPKDAAGGLVVRSRALDVVTLWGLAAAIGLLSANLVIR
jgi:hypothetical protein